MIAVAIVCAAAFAQAAAINWSFSETAPANPAHAKYQGVGDISGMEMYVFTTATWDSLFDNGYSSEALKKALDHATIPAKEVKNAGAANESWTFTMVAKPTKDLDVLTKDQSYALTYVVVDGDKYQAMAGTTAAIAYDPEAPGTIVEGKLNIGATAVPFKADGFTTFTDVVPEPTSGLLLLLGVAGLALRRRRA